MSLVIKAQFGAEFRRFPLFNEDQTYDDFLMMLSTRVFPSKLSIAAGEIFIKYIDEGMSFELYSFLWVMNCYQTPSFFPLRRWSNHDCRHKWPPLRVPVNSPPQARYLKFEYLILSINMYFIFIYGIYSMPFVHLLIISISGWSLKHL